jgi:putative Holliday junction resolvase
MKCLGIDYGERRIGLSFGDDLGVALPLPALIEASFDQRLEGMTDVVKEKGITDLVVGYPYNMDGSIGFKAQEVDRFIEKLESLFDLPVHRIDERLTSEEASRHLKKGRDDDFRRSGKIDSMAACLILQDFLNQKIGLFSSDNEGE